MKADIAALVFRRGYWREGEPTDRLDKVAETADDRASRAYECAWIDEDTEVAIAKAARKMRDAIKEERKNG